MHGDQIRVLQVELGCKVFTGVSSYLIQQYSQIDRDKIHYDFLYVRHNSMKMRMDDLAVAESKFFSLDAEDEKKKRINFPKIAFGLREVVKKNKYKILEIDTSNIFVAFVCRLALWDIRDLIFIAHAHTGGNVVMVGSVRDKHPLVIKITERVCKYIMCKKSDWLLACTESAGIFTFGRKAVKQENFQIIHNAIDLESFLPNCEVRSKVRKKNGIAEDYEVFGYVGRMAAAKNLDFLISVFAELHCRNNHSILWMVGEGDERKKIQARAEELGLGQSVVFFGQRSDVNDLMQGMDAFIFPSLMEGLGMVAIEAQASGLPTVVSDGVPDDVMITPLVRKVSLKASASEWADAVLGQMNRCPERRTYSEELAKAGYDVRDEARKMMEFYEKIAKQKRAGQRRKLALRIPQTELELDSAKAIPANMR